jgi:acetyltransferase-like isoleucine patch superfamily enzyme
MIHPSAIIECEVFELGENCYIGPNCKITCKEFRAGDYLWMPADVEIGRGGCNGPDSIVHIGNSVGIFEGTVINPSSRVTIGDCVGIGADCLLWTHGAWCDPLDGFPYSFASVTIGNNVWLPARSIMLPGSNIGDNVVIGTGSIITKDIPSGSLAMGSPCKVIKENEYPKKLSLEQKNDILRDIVKRWKAQLPHKGVSATVTIEDGTIVVNGRTVFNCLDYQVYGFQNELTEDLRDFLRRHGIRIYNGQPFKSLKPNYESSIESPSG